MCALSGAFAASATLPSGIVGEAHRPGEPGHPRDGTASNPGASELVCIARTPALSVTYPANSAGHMRRQLSHLAIGTAWTATGYTSGGPSVAAGADAVASGSERKRERAKITRNH